MLLELKASSADIVAAAAAAAAAAAGWPGTAGWNTAQRAVLPAVFAAPAGGRQSSDMHTAAVAAVYKNNKRKANWH